MKRQCSAPMARHESSSPLSSTPKLSWTHPLLYPAFITHTGCSALRPDSTQSADSNEYG